MALILPVLAGRAQALPPDDKCEVHVKPKIGISCGGHKLDLTVSFRYRPEWWNAFKGETDTFHGLRTRVGAMYSYEDAVAIFAEFQDARTLGLSPFTSGVGGAYRTWGDGNDPNGQDLRQMWVEIRPITGLAIRGGRQDINLGTQAMYAEAAWKYVKIKRASQRLVGTVGWSTVERTNDGFMGQYDTEGYNYYAFIANPTTGVFDHSKAYSRQKDIIYGGLSVTAKRGTWLDNTEFRGFFLGYDDDRPIHQGGKPKHVNIYTLGASMISVYPLGPGNFDVLLWAAGQAGTFNGTDQVAGAVIGEFGYQLPEVFAKPWFRIGVNYASGGDPSDSTNNTFFNMLPTNHLYYGFADQFAYQNLVDFFLQLMLKPHERVSINAMYHEFWLADDQDAWYFGTGAFTKKSGASGTGNFGYGARPSGGDSKLGREIDVVVNINVYKGVSVQGGYSKLWGGDVVDNLHAAGTFGREKIDWGYLQLSLQY
jgi:hypothetical protein